MGIWVLVTLATLGAVGFGQYRASQESARRTELQLRESQREKGRLLVTNQTLALRVMAVDNAFSDVRELVRRTVNEDLDVIYGLYADASGSPWMVVTPKTPETGRTGNDATAAVADLAPEEKRAVAPGPRSRAILAFGANVEEHAADVFDGSEYLGTVRYGISMARTEQSVRQELERARQSLVRLLTLLFLLGVAGIAMGVAAIRKMAYRITQPLSELARTAEELGRGNRDIRAMVSSGDEIEQLARTLNSMADANQRSMQALEVKTAEALESSRLKSEFLANMSHEIRTPMNGILGVVRLVHKMPLEGKLRRYIETIDTSASALLRIINDVLDFSKMEAGKYTIKTVPFDLRTVVQEVCELLATRAHDKGLELICRLDPRMGSLHHGDPDRIRQVVNNLLGNAIKFTERGEVFVDVRVTDSDARGETLRLAVLDTGIGIAQEDIPNLFDAFSQVDGSMVRKFGGTGLGLAISKRLVEMMGGTVGVKSALGEGSEFFCEIHFELAGNGSTDRGTWAQGKRALVVESHPRWQSVICEHLEAWGISVLRFNRAEEALGRVRVGVDGKLDVAVIGSAGGELTIDEFVRELRKLDAGALLPIVAVYQLGAGSFVSDVEKELVAQLPKPLRFSELYNALQETLMGEKQGSGKLRSSGNMPISCTGRVLVVDDNEINRFVAAEMLEQMGYEVETAENGAEAVEMVQRGDFLVVLMDCQMPVMDGYTATREIRRLEQGQDRHQPIVALTAHALSGERERVLAAGMDDYLSKPVRPSSLDKMIRRYARTRGKVVLQPQPLIIAGDEEPCLDPTVSRSRKLIELFLKNVPAQIAAIAAAAKLGPAAELRAHAHKTKGSCLALGAVRMARCAEDLQKVAETGKTDAAIELVAKLRDLYRDVEQELRQELGAF